MDIVAKTSDNFWVNKEGNHSPEPKSKVDYGVSNKDLSRIQIYSIFLFYNF